MTVVIRPGPGAAYAGEEPVSVGSGLPPERESSPMHAFHAAKQETNARALAADGLFAGLLAAIAVSLAFLIFDAIQGAPLHTPSVLGAKLFYGDDAARTMTTDVPTALAYNGIHFLAFVLGGLLVAYVAGVVERYPRYWYLAFTAVAFILAAIVYVDGAFGVTGLGPLRLSAVALLGCGVMIAFLLWRHPDIQRHLDDVWKD